MGYRVKRFKYLRQRTKYDNQKCGYDGSIYASKLEKKYAMDLDLRIKAGEIISWEKQVKIELEVNGYHICNYYIDFVVHYPNGIIEYVEVKGYPTDAWKIKWKLFEALYSDRIGTKLTIVRA